jgi:hypothetical protein
VNLTNAAVIIDTAGVRVSVFAELDDDRVGFKVEHDNANVTVYLTGTLEQLSEFACRIASTCAQHVIAQVENVTADVRT